MVIGVKLMSSSRTRVYCGSCRKTLKNGDEVAYLFAAPKRFYHVRCRWGGVKVAVLKSSPNVHINSCVPADRHPSIRARLAEALDETRRSLEHKLRSQLELKEALLQTYPIGTRLVHIYDASRIRFVELVGYSQQGNKVRVREVERIALDTWHARHKRFLFPRGWQNETIRQAYVLYEAQWHKKTDGYYTVKTAGFGDTLIRGNDFDVPFDYDPSRVREVPEAAGSRIVNVRTLAGRLCYSTVVGEAEEELTALQLQTRVANAIGLFYCRGTVKLLRSQGSEQPVGPSENLAELCPGDAPLELTAVLKEDSKWPVALDGRRLPYAYAQHIPVYNESLAIDITTTRVCLS